MELRHLRYFVAVAESLNFRRAAEQLRVTQPALSRQIKDLEYNIGAKLLERDTGGTKLTEAGIILLEEARDILERVEMAADLTRDAAAGRRGRLNIAGLGSLSADILSETLSAFRTLYPQVEVTLHDTNFHSLLADLENRTIHLGFTFDRELKFPPEFESVDVWNSKARVALGKNHRLCGNEQVSLRELENEDILCVGEPYRHDGHRKRTMEIFSKRGIYHRPIKRIGSLESLVALVAGNYGVSVLFPNLSYDSRQIMLRPVEEEGDDLLIKLSAVWRKNAHAQHAENFVGLLRKSRIAGDKKAPALA
jgi:DNA-binding transcriptional LysR family regulator